MDEGPSVRFRISHGKRSKSMLKTFQILTEGPVHGLIIITTLNFNNSLNQVDREWILEWKINEIIDKTVQKYKVTCIKDMRHEWHGWTLNTKIF